MQAWGYATFGRGANLTGGPLKQPEVQQQPLGLLADSSEGEYAVHRETVRPRQDAVSTAGVTASAVLKKLTAWVDATAPFAAREAEGK